MSLERVERAGGNRHVLGRVDSGDMSGGEDFYQDGVFVEHLVKGAVR